MPDIVLPMITLYGFFTSQKWLRGRTLFDMESLLGYHHGRLSTAGAAVYAFTRIPENWEFDLAGYTNVSGGMKIDPSLAAADRAASAYYSRFGGRSAETIRKDNARAAMSIIGENRLVKIKPLFSGINDQYPPGAGIPQWCVSDAAARRGTLSGILLGILEPGTRYQL